MFSKILSLMLVLMLNDNLLSDSGEKYVDEINSGESEISTSVDIEVLDSGDVEDTKSDITMDLGWELTLVNYDNKIPDGYEFSLENIDSSRQFDSRAIGYLRNMINDARKAGATNLWAQSTYRSVSVQENIYNNKVNLFLMQGKSLEEAKRLTEQTINKPGYSEHNLGLAVDFNYVNYDFENNPAFSWLTKNAENYGFVLRYKKEKEDITKVKYEPWHWRYVGIENAKEMNRLDMCLEEYVEYLKNK